jgi:hypothetical protein
LGLNHWALSGDWTVKPQAIVLTRPGGSCAIASRLATLHLVMAPPAPETPVRFRVQLDSQPPGAAHGGDVDDQGNGTLTDPRLYQLIRQPGPSPSAASRSASSTPASRPTPSPSARPQGAATMSTVSRGFRGRGLRPSVELPPGQYLVEDFLVLSAGPTPSIDLEDWELAITSETDQQRRSTWQEFHALPSQQVTVDLHCVTVARFEEWVAAENPALTSSREDPGAATRGSTRATALGRQATVGVEVFSPRQRPNNGGRHGPKR